MPRIENRVNTGQNPSQEGSSWLTQLGGRKREEQLQKTWRWEANYILDMQERMPNFFDRFRFFLPQGAIETALGYYQTPPLNHEPLPQTINLVRALIHHSANDVNGSGSLFFRTHPLPPGTFLITPDTWKEFKHLRDNSILTFFVGMINKDFLPQRISAGLNSQRFLEQQRMLFDRHLQKNPDIDRLRQISPIISYCLEAFYFQGKSLSQIAQERQLATARVHAYKELGLRALGIKQKAEGSKAEERYCFWLEPVLKRWKRNKTYIEKLPPLLQTTAWLLIQGKNSQEVAQECGLNLVRVQFLRRHLLSGVAEDEPFWSLKLHWEVENLFSVSFDKQPLVQITQAILAEKAQGSGYRRLGKIFAFDCYQIRYLLLGAFEDIEEVFPEHKNTLPVELRHIKQRKWQQIPLLYQQLIEEMVRRRRNLTPRQENFLKKTQTQTSLSYTQEGRFLNLYLGRISPRRRVQKERIDLARLVLRLNPNTLSPEEKRQARLIAQGKSLNEVFPKKSHRRERYDFFRKIEKIAVSLETSLS